MSSGSPAGTVRLVNDALVTPAATDDVTRQPNSGEYVAAVKWLA